MPLSCEPCGIDAGVYGTGMMIDGRAGRRPLPVVPLVLLLPLAPFVLLAPLVPLPPFVVAPLTAFRFFVRLAPFVLPFPCDVLPPGCVAVTTIGWPTLALWGMITPSLAAVAVAGTARAATTPAVTM